ncbi:MAG: hypothetical protein R2712_27660 [Vicinamibacterales bacterium]
MNRLTEVGEVLVHRRERRQAEAVTDFLQAGGIPMLLDELVQVVQNLALALGERLQRHLPGRAKRQENPGMWSEGSQRKGESQPFRPSRV